MKHIADYYKIPLTRLDNSNRVQDVKMILRDKMRLKSVVPKLEEPPLDQCSVCNRRGISVQVTCKDSVGCTRELVLTVVIIYMCV